MKTMTCPECDRLITLKPNGHGRCECGSHVKILAGRVER